MRSGLSFSIFFLFLITDLFAQTPDPVLYHGLEYRSIGPSRGGRSTAVAGVAEEPFTFYMGATGGGVWKTNDAGTTWRNISDGQIKAGSIGAITVAPSDVNVVYVGTGSACPRGNISPGIGIYRSTDKGKSWDHIGLKNAGQIGKIEVHPNDPDLVFVAALGNVFGPNPDRGVFRTRDGGKTWDKVLFVSDSTGAVDLAMDPKNPRIIYAAMWRAERKPWTLIDGGMEGGIWKSTDGGDNWKKLGGGLPTGIIGRIGLSVSPVNPERVWALIQTKEEKDGGLYLSDDAGSKWTKVNRDHRLRQRGWYYTHITADPQNTDVIYASNTRFYKSIDAGKSFEEIGTPHGDNHGVWINPNNPEIMINCNDGGANISLNGGETWSSILNQPTSEFYRVTVDNQFPYRLYAGQQDNSTISVPSSGSRGLLTEYQVWTAVGGAESGDVAVDPRDPNQVYAGAYSGEITWVDLSKEYSQERTAYPHYTEGTEQRDLKYRWQWNFPIAIDPFNPDHVYHTSNYVHHSDDKGMTWKVISPDLTRNLDQYHGIPGGPVQHDGTGVEIYSTIFAFELAENEEGVMWAGSDDGLVHVSRDGGNTWKNVSPTMIPREGTVNKIMPSVHEKGTVYIAVYNYRYQDFKPYILKGTNYGEQWKLLTRGNGIPNDHFTRVVVEDKLKKGLLYAGTEFGMYVSFDDGNSWKSLQLNLPAVPITDMEWKDNSLAISTQGRSFWVLDDLTPLRESVSVNKAKPALYSPNPAYRTNVYGKGLQLHFYIPSSEDVKIEISNGEEVLKVFSVNPEKMEQKLSVSPGFNSLYWNLRIPGPEIVPDFVSMVMSNRTEGPFLPPGNYTVTLHNYGESISKEFEVKLDPRWDHITREDLVQQYDMANDITDMIQESQDMIREIRSIREQSVDIADRAVKAGYSEELKAAADNLKEAITAVEDEIIQNKIETSQDAINYPRKFSNHIGRLYQVLMGSHGPPTGGVLERWEDIKQEHQANLDALKKVRENELQIFTELLAKENVTPVIVPGKKGKP